MNFPVMIEGIRKTCLPVNNKLIVDFIFKNGWMVLRKGHSRLTILDAIQPDVKKYFYY
jgi:hypothetical protein